jgi:hypothetical protein
MVVPKPQLLQSFSNADEANQMRNHALLSSFNDSPKPDL